MQACTNSFATMTSHRRLTTQRLNSCAVNAQCVHFYVIEAMSIHFFATPSGHISIPRVEVVVGSVYNTPSDNCPAKTQRLAPDQNSVHTLYSLSLTCLHAILSGRKGAALLQAPAPIAIGAAAAAVATASPSTQRHFAAVPAVPRLPAVAARAAAAAEVVLDAAATRPAPAVSGAAHHRWIPHKNAPCDSRPAMQPSEHRSHARKVSPARVSRTQALLLTRREPVSVIVTPSPTGPLGGGRLGWQWRFGTSRLPTDRADRDSSQRPACMCP